MKYEQQVNSVLILIKYAVLINQIITIQIMSLQETLIIIMDQVVLQFDELTVPDPFDVYRRIDEGLPSCLNCVNCIGCGCNFQKIQNPAEKPKQHISQSDEKPQSFKCQQQKCSKVFIDEDQFVSHTKKHDVVYECQFEKCQQRFKIKSNLKRHEKIHTKEKPFLCEECHKGFATTTNLKQHLQIHLGETKRSIFQCEFDGCEKKYYYLCNLKKHKKQHQQDATLVFKTPSFNALVGSCSFTLSTTLCSCDGLEKISFSRRQQDNKEEQLQDILEKALKQSKFKVGILLQHNDDVDSLTQLEDLLKWISQSGMKALHLSGLKEEIMLQFTEYIIQRLRKSAKK